MWFPGALEQDRITLSLTEMVWSPSCMNSKNFCFPLLIAVMALVDFVYSVLREAVMGELSR